MTGLNDNFLLADDSMEPKETPAVVVNAFKENPTEGAEPELRDDIDLIAVATEDLAVQLRDLELLQQNIKEQGGINQNIALEAHALLPDFLNDDRTIGFFTKHPSRTQLAAAMEDIDSGKKNIIMRMIDTILGFIKRILKKIKDFFIVDPETIKAQQEFAKNYKGPKAEEKVNNTAAKEPGNNNGSTNTDEAEVETEHQRAERWAEKLALVAAMLGKDRLPIIAALLSHESSLFENYEKTLEATNNILSDITKDNYGTVGDIANALIQECNKDIAEASAWSDVHQRDILNTWISYTNAPAVERIINLFKDGKSGSARILPGYVADTLETLESEIERLKNKPDQNDEVVNEIKGIQKLVSVFASFISLSARISSAYSTTIKGLKK